MTMFILISIATTVVIKIWWDLMLFCIEVSDQKRDEERDL